MCKLWWIARNEHVHHKATKTPLRLLEVVALTLVPSEAMMAAWTMRTGEPEPQTGIGRAQTKFLIEALCMRLKIV
jgi:hypothetical protein